LDVLLNQGQGVIVKKTPHPESPLVTFYEYRLYKRGPDGKVIDPKAPQERIPKPKSVINGLAKNEDAFLLDLSTAFDDAVRDLTIPTDSIKVQFEMKGLMMEGYLRSGVLDTVYPILLQAGE
jgi:hypothetical protein